ncbi:MAG: RNA 3'-terminal phosphate cyclase, partial [Anaerolineales bacterium]|nr:RNA 3'-terminal phosphate cyclase [Anaerolineales bacterium]
MNSDVIQIDGSRGEGGGQVLRTSLSVAAMSGRAMRISRIRAGRSNPGLAPQHLTAVRALARICGAELQGAQLRSTEIQFKPTGPPQGGEYSFDVADAAPNGSAGSVTLLAQALIPPLLFADSDSVLELRGGTHVR